MYVEAKLNNFPCVSATLSEWARSKERTKNVKFETLELTLAFNEWRVFFSFYDKDGRFYIANPLALPIGGESFIDELNEHFSRTSPFDARTDYGKFD